MLAEHIIRFFSRDPNGNDYPGGTSRANLQNALSFILKTVPEFSDLVRQSGSVLDFGCGYGLQAAALATANPSVRIIGLDLPRPVLLEKWRDLPDLPNLRLTTSLPENERFDLVFSCGSFEHFRNPDEILKLMLKRAKPGGLLVITFAEPWLSPRGSHMGGFCRLPWVNVLFPENAVMRVRSLYRSDGAMRYEDVEGGLNRMTVARFERFMKASGAKVRTLKRHPVKGLPMVSQVPVMRELMTAACSCILEVPSQPKGPDWTETLPHDKMSQNVGSAPTRRIPIKT